MGKTFFSYSSKDLPFVLRLAKDLRSVGVALWLDQLEIKGGTLWDSAVEEALKSAPNLIAFLSPESVKSEIVKDEISYALESGITVIPILLSKCDIPLRLRRLQRIDFTGDYQTGLHQLLDVLNLTPEVSKINKKTSSHKQYSNGEMVLENGDYTSVKELVTANNGIIEIYLEAVLSKIENLNFYKTYSKYDKTDTGIEKIFCPPSLKKIPVSREKNKEEFRKPLQYNPEKAADPNLEELLEVKQSKKSEAETLSETKIWEDVFNPESKGVCIVAPLGYGKTLLCQALFCFFAYRALSYKKTLFQEKSKTLWGDLLDDIQQYIPVYFNCGNKKKQDGYEDAGDLISDSIYQAGMDRTHTRYKSVRQKLMGLFSQDKIKLLFIIDAVDEFSNDENTVRKFMNFLNETIIRNRNGHMLLFSKRELFHARLNDKTASYDILGLDYEKQKKIILNLCSEKEDVDDYLNLIVPDLSETGLSDEIKESPFYLTNAVFYMEKNKRKNIIPSLKNLEKEMISIFFYRKDEKINIEEKYRLELVEKIALKIVDLNQDNLIEVDTLEETIKAFFHSKKVKCRPLDIVQELSQKIGILKRRELEDEKVYYSFFMQKYLDIIRKYKNRERIREKFKQETGLDATHENVVCEIKRRIEREGQTLLSEEEKELLKSFLDE